MDRRERRHVALRELVTLADELKYYFLDGKVSERLSEQILPEDIKEVPLVIRLSLALLAGERGAMLDVECLRMIGELDQCLVVEEDLTTEQRIECAAQAEAIKQCLEKLIPEEQIEDHRNGLLESKDS